MKKLNKLATGIALALSFTASANAGTFQSVTSEAVGVEAATTGAKTANIAGDSIVLDLGVAYGNFDVLLELKATGGATFNDSSYTLEQSLGGAGTGDLTEWQFLPADSSGGVLKFASAGSGVPAGADFILSGSQVAGQAVTFKLTANAAGHEVDLSAKADRSFGGTTISLDTFSAIELFQYANELSANVDTIADAVIDVNESRLKYTGAATSDTIALEFNTAGLANGVTLNDNDKVDIVLTGDMSTIQNLVLTTDGTSRGNFTIANDMGSATFEASASDVFSAASTVITANVWASGALATRSFKAQADLDFESETDKNLVAQDTNAGEWTINGLQAKVSHMSINTTGFISWLKVANEGTTAAEISADIIYTLADGTEGSVNAASLGVVDAGGVATVSEATIISAIGSPTQLADVSMTVTVAGQTDLIHLIAEKKAASGGRVSIPVYYGAGRTWTQ